MRLKKKIDLKITVWVSINKKHTHTQTVSMASLLRVKKLSPDAIVFVRKSTKAAGHDICSIEDVVLPPRQSVLVSTGIAIQLPENTYGQIAPRSGLSVKGVDVGAGVIDEDYRGEIKVLLRNQSDQEIRLQKSERIAQLLVLPVLYPLVVGSSDLSDTERGENGFGSSGAV